MKKQHNIVIVIVIAFFMLILAIVVGMNVKNTMNLRSILADSVKSQLISTSIAAREMIDVDAFVEYEDESVAELPEYRETLSRLRALCNSVGAQYIYALKKQGDQYVFVFDTDTENEEIFIDYELSPVHKTAFSGVNAADIMNVDDEYGSFNTGAVPIRRNNVVVGIVCTDTEDQFLSSSFETAFTNSVLMVGILVVAMLTMLLIVLRLLKHLAAMRMKLQQQALYDNVTKLPNRQYLMDHLAKLTSDENKQPFALFFVDLDNFKRVNDNAGHDAGDELLRHIGQYLDSAAQENTKSFRVGSGPLNIAARVGGDEFIQVVGDVDTEERAAEIATSLLDNFKSQHVDRYVEKYNVGLSIGVALYPYHSDNYHVIIKYADMAMYAAKHSGKNNFRIYADEMNQPGAIPERPEKR